MEKKVCTKCKRELSIEEFRWKNKLKGKKHSQCKECQRQQEKERYQVDIARKEKLLDIAQKQKSRNAIFIEQNKQCGCAKCGEKRHYVLDFHHIDPSQKNNTINNLRTCSLETLQKEIEKCIVLCSNCHREFHHFEFEQNITLRDYLGW